MDERNAGNGAPENEAETQWIYNKLELQGNVAVLTSMTKANRHARVRRLDKHTYRDEATGEVREYQHKENRSQNRNSLLRTFSKIRGIVNANSEYPASVKFITLTYAEQWREEHDPTYSLETSLEDPVTGFETRIRKEWYSKTKEGL
jgi:hypothetical protein